MKRRCPILISIIAIASLISLTAFGQVSSSISGTVNDPNGEVVSGATVMVKNVATGYGNLGPPTGRYIAPANSANCIQALSGDCAPQSLIVNGPMFARFDMSAVKRVKINERINFELRGEILNAFNHINFFGVTCASSSDTCGEVTSAYRDVNNTQDPGGRMVQIVARFNF